MAKVSKADVERFRETIKSTGEVRIHLITSRTGGTCTARMWHPDGFRVGTAGGYGYDKQGTALGEAIGLLFGPELLTLTPRRSEGVEVKNGLYGLTHRDGKAFLDGACGLSSMLKVLEALGFDVREFDTGKLSTMVLGTRKTP